MSASFIPITLHFTGHLFPMEMLSETNNPPWITYNAAMYIMSVKCALQFNWQHYSLQPWWYCNPISSWCLSAPRSCISQRVFNIQIMPWVHDVSHSRRQLFLFLLHCNIHFELACDFYSCMHVRPRPRLFAAVCWCEWKQTLTKRHGRAAAVSAARRKTSGTGSEGCEEIRDLARVDGRVSVRAEHWIPK